MWMKMKTALCALALCTSTVLAQSNPRVSLDLGRVTVWLGMDIATARQKLEAAGIFFDKPDSNGNVIAVDPHFERTYFLHFENNKLSLADQNWLHDDSDGLTSVMDALESLVDKGASRCTIGHAHSIPSPGMKVTRVFIDCGERSLILESGSANGGENGVFESIGNPWSVVNSHNGGD
jgi:hypothetical protein